MEKGLVSALMSSGNRKFKIPFGLTTLVVHPFQPDCFATTGVLCVKCENKMGREDRVKKRGGCIKDS